LQRHKPLTDLKASADGVVDADIAGTWQRMAWFLVGVLATLIILAVLFGWL